MNNLRKALTIALCLAPTIATAQWSNQYDRETRNPTYYQQEQLQLQRERNEIMRRQYEAGNPTANYPVWDHLRQRNTGPDPTDVIIQHQMDKYLNRD